MSIYRAQVVIGLGSDCYYICSVWVHVCINQLNNLTCYFNGMVFQQCQSVYKFYDFTNNCVQFVMMLP